MQRKNKKVIFIHQLERVLVKSRRVRVLVWCIKVQLMGKMSVWKHLLNLERYNISAAKHGLDLCSEIVTMLSSELR